MTDQTSYSALTMHRSCPQKWMYRNVRGLRPLDEEYPVERDFGSWWHMLRAAEAIERGRVLGSLRKVPRELRSVDDGPTISTEGVAAFDVVNLLDGWWDGQTEEYRQVWVSRLGLPAIIGIPRTLERWRERWAADIKHEQPLAVEMDWGRDLPTVGGDSPETRIGGFIDEVYLDLRRNIVVVRDHKTSKALDTQTAVDDMMDSQLQLYAWGASAEIKDWGVGGVRATAYDRTRSVAPKPPFLTKSGRLGEHQGEPSVGQCDLATYLEWVESGPAYPGLKKDGSGAGVYVAEERVIERLASPAAGSVWFQRTLVPLNTNIVRAHLRSAVDSALDVRRTRLRAAVTNEAARNLGAPCRYCDFVRLCRVEMIGGPDGDYDLEILGLREKAARR